MLTWNFSRGVDADFLALPDAGQSEKRVTLRVVAHVLCNPPEGRLMAKPNYSFEKRQRELAKKKKKEEKIKDKAGRKVGSDDGDSAEAVPGEGGSTLGTPSQQNPSSS